MKDVRAAMLEAIGHLFDGDEPEACAALSGLTDWDLVEVYDAASDLRDLADDIADGESEAWGGDQ